jgi:hypothetical protein
MKKIEHQYLCKDEHTAYPGTTVSFASHLFLFGHHRDLAHRSRLMRPTWRGVAIMKMQYMDGEVS